MKSELTHIDISLAFFHSVAIPAHEIKDAIVIFLFRLLFGVTSIDRSHDINVIKANFHYKRILKTRI